MLHRRFARLLLMFTALLLPLQTIAAVSMSLGRQDATPQAMMQASAGEHEHCAYHDAAPATDRAAHEQCNDCGICHLACAGYMPPSEIAASVAPFAHVYQSGPLAARLNHIPEPPCDPPRRGA